MPTLVTAAPPKVRSGLILVVVLVAALAINLDTTIVNVALPSINGQLHAGTSSLQWIVDGYNLAFAALVLAGGCIGDRRGRRGTLAAGLGLFAVASVAAAASSSVGQLVAVRLIMGASAALIYPTTLSIITNTFTERKARAGAIGAWGAITGLGVASGPVLGGVLLVHFWWGSVFLALVPVAIVALIGVWVAVPTSHDPDRAPLDQPGVLFSVVGLGALVYSVIEAPQRGWTDPRTLVGFAMAAVALGLLFRHERHHAAPLLDVRLFANPRFSAASGAVTVAFFGLFGFIFLITQYFQRLRGFSPLSTGVRILPVALSIAVASVVGVQLVVRFGNKAVAALGLLLLGGSFFWIGFSTATLDYKVIVIQMLLMGSGLGMTSIAATEAIMGVVRPEQAGAGSAVNDATREVGGTLGVAVIGSVYASGYGHHLLSGPVPGVGAGVLAGARRSFGDGLAASGSLADRAAAAALHARVDGAFLSGLHAGCRSAAAVCLVGAVAVAVFLPSHPGAPGGRPPAS